ncbi:MAG: thiamine diphosphokinase [Spirochaetaceae bacterium]|jgi:thiamine pyrophosphokinase|nr:thiamine diphosphokinase [Spirochaetaceae bacterium]
MYAFPENRRGIDVIFTGGEAPPPQRCRELAEGAGRIIAADSGLIACEEAGFTPDFVTGDMDSLEEAGQTGRLRGYEGRVFRHPRDKDETDTELAIALARQLRREEGEDGHVRLIGGGGGRLDHLFAIRELFENESPPLSWHTKNEDMYWIEADGEKADFTLRTRHGAVISLLPLSSARFEGKGWKIRSGGLKWETDNVRWKRGFVGICNVSENDTFTLFAECGRFMVIVNI